jgi:DNA-binding transcriptional MerR regulator
VSRFSGFRTAADTARRLGLTVRALRVYERHGVVQPGRTAAGWRVYGPEEVARLHQVTALKRLGLTLSQIAVLLRGRGVDLEQLLAAQEDLLTSRKQRIDRALLLVRRARARLAKGETLPADDLVELTKETVMSDQPPGPEMKAIFEKHVDSERVKHLHPQEWTAADQERVSADWNALIAEAEHLKGGDPASPEAIDLARRWMAQVAKFTRGDAQVNVQLAAAWREVAADPKASQQMPFSPDVWQFIQKAQAAAGGC